MVTADKLDVQRQPLQLTTRLNGAVVQKSDTSLPIFQIPGLIAYCSTLLPLSLEDVIVTRTPGGVGMTRTPQLFLKPGDRVEGGLSVKGVLCNVVAMDSASLQGRVRSRETLRYQT